ncbi:unnamed protein product, partial [Rotaria socialis]
MMAIAAQNDVDIKIVDDVNYQPTDEDRAKGTDIVLYTKGEVDSQGKNSVGHYRLMLGDGTVIDVPSDNNNCGYAVIQKILKDRDIDKSVEDLRNDRAQNIEDNPREFLKVDNAQRWIESRHPADANRLLMMGSRPKEKSSASEDKSGKDLYTNTEYDNIKFKNGSESEIRECTKKIREEAENEFPDTETETETTDIHNDKQQQQK